MQAVVNLNQLLDNSATCHDQQIFNDTQVILTFRKPGTKDEYEELFEAAQEEYYYDYPARKKEEPKKDD